MYRLSGLNIPIRKHIFFWDWLNLSISQSLGQLEYLVSVEQKKGKKI